MKEKITAKVYAQALAKISSQKNVMIADELTLLTEAINSSNDLENVLFLDVFSDEDKKNVFSDIASKLKLSPITKESVNFLIDEKRISLLPLIYKEVIVAEDEAQGFLRGTIEGSVDSISESDMNKLIKQVEKYADGKQMKFDYKKTDSLTAGYKVSINDIQLDASVDTQFKELKNAILH